MKIMQMGNTFLADKPREDGIHSESPLDHIDIQQDVEENVKTTKVTKSAINHVPIMTEILTSERAKA
jgi:hypothetical protein